MKTTSIYPIAALFTLGLAACNNNENEYIPSGSQNTPTFTASIDGHKNTRAYDQAWELGDAIGITGTSGTKVYTNVKHITWGNGNFGVATSSETISYQDNKSVNFTAYYPWSTSTTITASTEKQKEQSTFDFLYGTGTGSTANPNVAFRFSHKMTKVVLTIKKGVGVSFNDVQNAKLSLEGFLHKGTFDGLTGEVTVTEGTTAKGWCFAGNADEAYNAQMTTDDREETVTYTLICFPQVFTTSLLFTATLENTQTFTASLDFTDANASKDQNPGNYWIGGRQYNIGIRLNKQGITAAGSTTQAWEEVGNNYDVDAQQTAQ